MFAAVRAGGLAAAIIVISATGLGAGPSQAWELSHAVSNPNAQPSTDEFVPAVVQEPAQILLPVQTAPANSAPGVGTVVVDTPAAAAAPAETADIVAPVVIAPPPVRRERASLAELVAAHRSSAIPDRERECLAGAIYFESKGEPLPGQIAVGQVIANRAKSGRFPKSFCGVVFQRSQFSFVRRGSLPPIPRASAHWKTAVAVAHIVANELHDAVAPKALFFHARYVSPNWKKMSKVATVGNHVFYR